MSDDREFVTITDDEDKDSEGAAAFTDIANRLFGAVLDLGHDRIMQGLDWADKGITAEDGDVLQGLRLGFQEIYIAVVAAASGEDEKFESPVLQVVRALRNEVGEDRYQEIIQGLSDE